MKVLVIDIGICNGCFNCQVACKDEFVGNDWPPYSLSEPDIGQFWMKVDQKVRGSVPKVKVAYTPQPCMHCDDAPCIKAATNGAIYKRSDGIVIIDPVKSKGQKQIVDSCPYGRIFWNDALQIPQKCNLCLHRLEQGLQPACVNACPTQVSIVGDEASTLAAKIKAKNAQILNPEFKADPRVYYANLPPTATTT